MNINNICKKKNNIKKKDFFKIDSGLITAEMLPRDTIKKVRLKAGSNKRDYMIFVILNEGGLRVSELINLELNRDVNLDMRKLLILGKGNKAREIFINNIMYDAIEDYLPEREKILNGRTNKYLIVSNKTANTNRPIERTSINNLLNKYCKSINEKCINPHILRHECATKRYEEGYSDMMLKKILGQTSNVTNRYVHAGNENIKR